MESVSSATRELFAQASQDIYSLLVLSAGCTETNPLSQAHIPWRVTPQASYRVVKISRGAPLTPNAIRLVLNMIFEK